MLHGALQLSFFHTHTTISRVINRYNEIVYVRKSAMRWLWRYTRSSSPDKGESVTGKCATRTRASLSLSLSLSLSHTHTDTRAHTHTHTRVMHIHIKAFLIALTPPLTIIGY